MRTCLHIGLFLSIWIATPCCLLAQGVATTTLYPDQDNTLIENLSGSFSNGASEHLFIGRVGPQGDFRLRRSVIRFDLSTSLPDQIEILDASLSLHITRAGHNDTHTYTLHRLTSDWGEGTSNFSGGVGNLASENDATWIHTFYDTQRWQTPGGDFLEEPSATFQMSIEGSYTIDLTDNLLADLQFWIDNPEFNFGWILIGNEQPSAVTAVRISSREHANEAYRPQLFLEYIDPALPVELSSFTGIADGSTVYLEWHTSSETNNAGFEVQLLRDGTFYTIGFVNGAGTTAEPQHYRYVLTEMLQGSYSARLKQVDFDGTFSYSPVVELTVTHPFPAPALTISPNPFNPATRVNLTLYRTQRTDIAVFNVTGQKINTLFSGTLEAGQHSFHLVPTVNFASGIYIVQAAGESFLLNERVVYLK